MLIRMAAGPRRLTGADEVPPNFTVKLAAPGFGPGLKPLGQS